MLRESSEMKEYLKRVMDLEVSCYKQSAYIDSLKNRLYTAQNPRLWTVKNFPQKVSVLYGILRTLILALVIGGVISGGAYFYEVVTKFLSNISGHAYHRFLSEKTIIGIGASIFALVMIIGICQVTKDKRKNQKTIHDIATSNADALSKNESIRIESRKQAELIREEITNAEQLLKETRAILEKYYNCEIIFEKYRSLVPVTMFYEYFSSGRCSKLDGHEGAYNIYENEARMNLILTKLDDIIKRLDQIARNQYILMHQMQEVNASVGRLTTAANRQTRQLERISQNQEVSNYYNQITAMNTSYMAWSAFLKN